MPCRLVNGTRDLLRQQRGLAHHANYHEFCRLLGRLKANYQLSELVRSLSGQARLLAGGAWRGPRCRRRRPAACRPFCSPDCPALCPATPICVQVGLESYKEWIQLVAEFTISSLNSWQWASGSVYYLLGLWCALWSCCATAGGGRPCCVAVFC